MFHFWAKTDTDSGTLRMHSVPHHCLDVAAAAQALLEIFPPPVAVPHGALVALIALHDIGKFSRVFQAQVPELWPVSLGPFQAPPAGHRHDEVGYSLMTDSPRDFVAPLFDGWRVGVRQPILRAVAGHHGRPPIVTELLNSVACASCLDAASEFADAVFALLNPSPLPKMSQRERHLLTWWLAGFTTLADWVGSSRNWFPTVDGASNADLGAYWERACAQAARAVREAGLIPAAVSAETGMRRLFPERPPRPLQRWAEGVELPAGQCLVVVEDATGSGKTESAMVLAHRLMQSAPPQKFPTVWGCPDRGGDGARSPSEVPRVCGDNSHGARGLYIALPTKATADAMYGRLSAVYPLMFLADSRPSLMLTHGSRILNRAFTNSVLKGVADGEAGFRDEGAAQCAAWLGDRKKLAFYAQIGAGTIDQALLSILPTKHAQLRMLGLSQRVLIIDESHAYDSYVSHELERLLEFHAALGGSAIVLSATLTAEQRASLAAAFRRGLGCEDDLELEPTEAYPAATVVSAAGAASYAVKLADDLARSVAVERIGSMGAAANEIVAAARAGGAVCWIRNTVDDSIEACELLRAHGLEPVLFHARFAMGDRLAVENEVLRLFGYKSTPEQRAGRVLVATQVVEQSLDLDFDLMVSDIAPADLVIQRAGRLWRHPHRDVRPVPGPRLLLLSPEPVDEPPPGWLGDIRTRWVYDNPAVLWRSARALLGAGQIVTPTNIRTLVEAAYDEANTPAGLRRSTRRAEGNEGRARGVADQNVLAFESAYELSAGRWAADEHTPTRLGDPTVTVRLAKYADDGRLVSWFHDRENPVRNWPLSEVSIRAARISGVVEDAESAADLALLRAHWPEWDRETLVLVLRPVGEGIWLGRVLDRDGAPRDVSYSRTTGWRWRG